MKNFYSYLAESIRYYRYRVRTLNPITPDDISMIENIIGQYDPISISEPKRTPLQDSPMDFPNYSMVSVYIIDIELKIPVSTYILQNRIRAALNIPNSSIIIRMDNDPVELETMRLDDFGNWDEREPLLSTSPIYHEYNYAADEVTPYGDEYNQNFLKFLAAVKKNRKDIVSEVQPENTTKSDYAFLNSLATEDAEFNKGTDSVLPVYQNEITGDEQNPVDTAIHGNFDSISRIASKIIQK